MRLDAFTSQLRASTSSVTHRQPEADPIVPGSPPPYSPEPPESVPLSPFLVRRSSSTPHLNSPPLPCAEPRLSNTHSYSQTNSRNPSSSALYSHPAPRHRASFSREETDEDTDAATSGDDTVVYRSPRQTIAGSLRERLFGKGKARADHGERTRLISTTPGVHGAGETETEGEDTPRNLPTARLRTPTLSSLSAHSPLSASMTIPLPSLDPAHRQRAILDLAPLLFESCRLLAVVPAVFGTFWNLYRALMPLEDGWRWRVDYVVCIIWSVLTGWQCLQLTTGLLKRWRVYYSPLPTLIRLLALQAICWPATHFTLTLLDHEARPLICWAAIGTTTCCSRSIQMWVTSNIVEPPGSAPSDANMKRRSKRKWDGPAVLRECVLPAGVAYAVTAWVAILSREFEGACGRSG